MGATRPTPPPRRSGGVGPGTKKRSVAWGFSNGAIIYPAGLTRPSSSPYRARAEVSAEAAKVVDGEAPRRRHNTKKSIGEGAARGLAVHRRGGAGCIPRAGWGQTESGRRSAGFRRRGENSSCRRFDSSLLQGFEASGCIPRPLATRRRVAKGRCDKVASGGPGTLEPLGRDGSRPS